MRWIASHRNHAVCRQCRDCLRTTAGALCATRLQPTGLPSTSLHRLSARANFYPNFYPDQRAGWVENDELAAPGLFDGEQAERIPQPSKLAMRVRFPSPAPRGLHVSVETIFTLVWV